MIKSDPDWRIVDPDKYKWGIFYFNPQDSRIIVQKRIRWMGWTLNFAKPYSYIIIAIFIALGILIGNLDKIVR